MTISVTIKMEEKIPNEIIVRLLSLKTKVIVIRYRIPIAVPGGTMKSIIKKNKREM
jgi:hypothetical protein